MVHLPIKPALLLTSISALAAASPQWGGGRGRGGWRDRPTEGNGPIQSSAAAVPPPAPSATTPPIISDGSATVANPAQQPTSVSNGNTNGNNGNTNNNSNSDTSDTNNTSEGVTGGNSGGKCDSDANGCRPGGKKAGIAEAGKNELSSVSLLGNAISWYYDWGVAPPSEGNVIGVPILWGGSEEFTSAFDSIGPSEWLLGFNEPDCQVEGVAEPMDPSHAATVWNDHMVGKIGSNTKVGSPSPCDQAGTWLDEFKAAGLQADWDFTAIHIYKDTVEGAEGVIDHYSSLGKPIWVTEFACVHDGFVPCTDQDEINGFIAGMVDMLEQKDIIRGYAALSSGNKLEVGTPWAFVSQGGGQLSASGQAYLDAISKY